MAHDILPHAGDPPVPFQRSTDYHHSVRLLALSRRLLELRREAAAVELEITAIATALGA